MKNNKYLKFIFTFAIIAIVIGGVFVVTENYSNTFAVVSNVNTQNVQRNDSSLNKFASIISKLNIFRYAEALLQEPICDSETEFCEPADGGSCSAVNGICGLSSPGVCNAGAQFDLVDNGVTATWSCGGECGGFDTQCDFDYPQCGTGSGTCTLGILYGTVQANGTWQCRVGTKYKTCSPPPVNMVCGTTLNSCAAGTFSDLADSGTTYFWQCNGLYGGYSGMCSMMIPVNGSCGGWLNGCNAGSYSDTADDASNNKWNCAGQYGGTTASCTYPKTNGACSGTLNTCSVGTYTDVTDNSINYLWDCTGANNGTTANCSKLKPPYAPTISGTSGHGLINTTYFFDIAGSDPAGYQVKYQTDVDDSAANLALSEANLNETSLGASGWSYHWGYEWPTPGVRYFRSRTVTSDGRVSPWNVTQSVTIHALPTATLSTSVTSVENNTAATVTWSSTDTAGCSVTKNGVAWQAGLSGSAVSTGALTVNTTFALNCNGYGGSTASASKVITIRVNGTCGGAVNACTVGTSSDVADTAAAYLWNCVGSSGGSTASCSIVKPPVVTVTANTANGGTTGSAYASEPATVTWTATNSPGNCYIYRNGSNIAMVGGSDTSYTTAALPEGNTTYRVDCFNGSGTGTGNTVTFTVPTSPTGLTASCPNPGTMANFSWTLPSGITKTYFRYYKSPPVGVDWNAACGPVKSPPNGNCTDFTGSSIAQTMTTNTDYYWYIHSMDAYGNWSYPVGSSVYCYPPAPNAPTIGNPNPAIVGIGQNATFSISATDSIGANVRYAIDSDNNDTVDSTSGYGVSGSTYVWHNDWAGCGSKTFKVRAESADGRVSAWTSKTIDIVCPCVPTISFSPTSYVYGNSLTVTWGATGAASGAVTRDGAAWQSAISGSAATGALTTDVTFVNSCINAAGQTVSEEIMIPIYPKMFISTNTTGVCGFNQTISWTTGNAASCTIKKDGAAWMTGTSNAGVQSGVQTALQRFDWSCTSPIGNVSTGYMNTPVTALNGACSTSLNTCTAGTFADVADSASAYLWNCNGGCGGTTATGCSKLKPPVVPVITGPTSGAVNTNYNFPITGTDNAGYQVKYGIDWDNDGVQNGETALGASDWIYTWVNQWAGAGPKYFKAKTITSDGRESAWSATSTITLHDVPVVALSSSAAIVDYNTAASITWTSSDATSCSITKNGAAWQTGLSGTAVASGALTTDTTFVLSCTGIGGTNTSTTIVKVRPSVTITATPSSIAYGATSTIAWSSTYASSCAVTKAGAAWMTGVSNAGSLSGVLNANTAFVATCTSASGATKAASVTVTVAPLNGVCTTTHYTCSKGTSVNNVSGAMQWTWSCNGANGGTNAACSQVKPAPNVPTITGPVTGEINTEYSFNVQASNTSGDPIRYAIDWDNTGTVDGYLPIAGTTTQGTLLVWKNQWAGSGIKTFKIRTETNGGPVSAWATWNITMYGVPTITWTPASATVPYGGRLTLGYTSTDSTYCNLFSTVAGDENTWEATPFWSNASTTFTWTNAGTYEKNFKRKAVCYNPFGDYQSVEFSATVLQNAATCGNITFPEYLLPGESFSPVFTMNNTGANVWTNGSPLKHRLYSTSTSWGNQYLSLTNGPVAQGSAGIFSGTLIAPAVSGNYPISFRVMEELEATSSPLMFGPVCPVTTTSSTDTDTIVVKNPTLGIGTTDIDMDLISFPGNYVTNDPAVYRTLTVRNRGGGTLDGTISIPAGKFACTANCNFSIGPGGSHDATISFESAVAGNFGEFATVTADGGAQVKTVNLTISTGEKFTITKTPLDFGEVATSRSKVLTLTITNNSIGQSGGTFAINPTAPFYCVSGCSSATLAAKATRTIRLKYNPTTVDVAPVSQDITLLTTPNITIRLEGQGIKPEFKVKEQ